MAFYRGIELLRGSGRVAGVGVVEVDGVPHTAHHIVLATGSDPVIPPISGLAQLSGVWTSCEATAMRAVPKRLVVLGGGPVGVEMAQAVRRLGGEVALIEGASRLLGREPAPLGRALADVLRRDGVELAARVQATRAGRDGEDYVVAFDDGRQVRGDRLLVATGRRPRGRWNWPRHDRNPGRPAWHPGRRPCCASPKACGPSATSPAYAS